jgi:signal transduction histidine kinase
VLRASDAEAGELAPQPGIGELEELVDRVCTAGLHAELRVTGARRSISPLAGMTVYRIAQEALTNVLRHGTGATTAEVYVNWRDEEVELEIVDNGRLDSGAVAVPGDGRGIAGMRERAGLHGALLSAGPCFCGGWRVITRIPLDVV